MSRPARRHARKASATTAEDILMPFELTVGLTSLSPSPPTSTRPNQTMPFGSASPPQQKQQQQQVLRLAPLVEAAADEVENPKPNTVNLELAPLFSFEDLALETASEPAEPTPPPADPPVARTHPDKGILKEPKKEQSGSRWSLFNSAKWFGNSHKSSSEHLRFAQGAGIPAVRIDDDEAAMEGRVDMGVRTAPSIDFERSTSVVPPLSQERITSTEFWTNFALELDPSKLRRIRFSMPLIVTEFDPETARVSDRNEDSARTVVETTDGILKNSHREGRELAKDATLIVAPPPTADDEDSSSEMRMSAESERSLSGGGVRASSDTRRDSSSTGSERTSCDSLIDKQRGRRPIQWDVGALTSRQYRVQEVWELYERTCKTLDVDPLPSFADTLQTHMRKEQTLGSLDLSGCQLDGVHMKGFADILDLNFGLVKLELSHCNIDDDAARLLVYSLLCNDSVRYLGLSNNSRLRSDGIRYISILIRHSKQLQVLDISGIAIRKKSAGYLAAALAGLGSNWMVGRGSMRKKASMCEQVSLKALRMNSCGIKPAALAILASGVRLSPLQHLSLRLNSLTSSAGPILREMLYGDPPQLAAAASSQNPVARAAMTPKRPISISLHGLSDAQHCHDPSSSPYIIGVADTPRLSQLRSLDLSQNELGRGMMDLAEGLLWNTNLKSLVLRQNKLQPTILASFIECLGVNTGLAYLDISRNPVCGPSTAGIEALSQVIARNRTLHGLFMSTTGMTSEGAITLAECLPDLHALERLDVSDNPGIELAGLMALSASIKLNRSLICFEITVNTGDEVCAAMEQAIAQTCIANMQRLDTTVNHQQQHQSNGSDFGLGLVSTHVWPHADKAPASDLPGVVVSRFSSEGSEDGLTSLVTDLSAVKRPSAPDIGDMLDEAFDGPAADDDDDNGHDKVRPVVKVEDDKKKPMAEEQLASLVIPDDLADG